MNEMEKYRIYGNKPTCLMGCPIVYYISDNAIARSFGGDSENIDKAILEEHPTLSKIRTVRVGDFTYKGVNFLSPDRIMEGPDE